MMEVILKEDIQNLGFKDEVVTVKDGYGRNYLIPRGMAVIASASAKKVLAENNRQRAHKLEKIKKDAEALAKRIEGTSLLFKVHTSSQGNVYGSISPSQIAEELEKKGIEVDRKRIKINGTVKKVGNYTATLLLHREVSVELPFEVISENPGKDKEQQTQDDATPETDAEKKAPKVRTEQEPETRTEQEEEER